LRNDIVRYYESPHTIENGEKALVGILNFCVNSCIEFFGTAFNNKKQDIENICQDYITIFSSLVSDGSLVLIADSLYQSVFVLEEKPCAVC
jgi:hypothetical protein